MKLSRLAIVPIALAVLALFGVGLAASQTPSSTSNATQAPAPTTSAAATTGATQAAGATTATPGAIAHGVRHWHRHRHGHRRAGQGTPFSVNPIVVKLAPSVVRIQTEAANLGSATGGANQVGVGSGVILDSQGHIVTDDHVVTLDSGQPGAEHRRHGQCLEDRKRDDRRRDPATDLAVLKIDPAA